MLDNSLNIYAFKTNMAQQVCWVIISLPKNVLTSSNTSDFICSQRVRNDSRTQTFCRSVLPPKNTLLKWLHDCKMKTDIEKRHAWKHSGTAENFIKLVTSPGSVWKWRGLTTVVWRVMIHLKKWRVFWLVGFWTKVVRLNTSITFI